MLPQMRRSAGRYGLLALVLIACSLAGCHSEPLEVAPNVSLSELQGKWYEIARLPRMTEVDCHGTTAFYTQAPNGSLGLVNQCNVGSATGPLQTISMTATAPDRAVPAKLALRVGGYTGDYWILEVGPNYEYSVVGHPSRLYLWILSRTPSLDANVLKGILDRAQAAHFDTTQLEYTPQPPAGERNTSDSPEGTVPSEPQAGCAIVQPRANSRATLAWSGLLGAALTSLGFRRRKRRNRAGS